MVAGKNQKTGKILFRSDEKTSTAEKSRLSGFCIKAVHDALLDLEKMRRDENQKIKKNLAKLSIQFFVAETNPKKANLLPAFFRVWTQPYRRPRTWGGDAKNFLWKLASFAGRMAFLGKLAEKNCSNENWHKAFCECPF